MTESALTVQSAQRSAVEKLNNAGIKNPGFDARLLLASAMNVEMAQLISMASDRLDSQILEQFSKMISQRIAGKPVHRILGYREFFGRRFNIGLHCLEPRPETELLVERVLDDFKNVENVSFGEIGVGSGAIIVTLLCELPQARGLGTDISPEALKDAAENAALHTVEKRAEFVVADCFAGVSAMFDFIVSNPPYIPSGEIYNLETEVQEHDPLAALDGGADGLDIYRRILEQSAGRLKYNGRLYLETGHGQHEAIAAIASKMGWGIISTHLDLSGLERIVVLQAK